MIDGGGCPNAIEADDSEIWVVDLLQEVKALLDDGWVFKVLRAELIHSWKIDHMRWGQR